MHNIYIHIYIYTYIFWLKEKHAGMIPLTQHSSDAPASRRFYLWEPPKSWKFSAASVPVFLHFTGSRYKEPYRIHANHQYQYLSI